MISFRHHVLPRMKAAMPYLGFAALVTLGLEYGFDHPPLPIWLLVVVQLIAVACYLVTVVASVWLAPAPATAARRLWPDLSMIVLGIITLILMVNISHRSIRGMGSACVGATQVLLVCRVVGAAIRWNLEMSRKQLHPSRLLVISFALVILIGGCLLSLPKAVSPPIRAETGVYVAHRILNGFFTSVSATCVTGLVVYDTGHDYTRFGQIVILVLIQLGGLGIMMFGSVAGMLIGKQLSLRQSLVLQDELSHDTVGHMRAIVKFILVTTFICEALGALALYPMFADKTSSTGDCIFHCIFHAISAFCNAGFALQADSLVTCGSWFSLYCGVMPLIVIGGLGFPVLSDLWAWFIAAVRPWSNQGTVTPSDRPGPKRVRPRHRLKLHTKLVLVSSAGLIVVPALLFFVFESIEWRTPRQLEESRIIGHAMIDMGPLERSGAALFQSVTARTAGFNSASLDTQCMSPASHFLLTLLMFVGGSPASTAGGVKTVTVAVLVVGVINTLRGRRRVECYGKTIPDSVLRHASVVGVVMFAAVAIVTILLCLTESISLRESLFESVSALGTVGLSTGITDQLTPAGRIIIMLAMFAGRLGPLTLLIALAGNKPPLRYEYPSESVVIG